MYGAPKQNLLGSESVMIKIRLILPVLHILAATAYGHHIRGIPHYTYQDHYPETPVYEVTQTVNNYDVTFTYYKIPGQGAYDLAIYIRDIDSSKVFDGAVIFKVFGKHEDPTESHPFTAYRNPTNIYKVGWVYEDDGHYYVRVSFNDGLRQNNVLFDLKVGMGNPVWTYLGGSIAFILSFAVIVAILKKRRFKERKS